MKSEFLGKEKNNAKFTIEFTAEEFEAALQKAYLKERGKISVDGFRKGKAPRNIVEQNIKINFDIRTLTSAFFLSLTLSLKLMGMFYRPRTVAALRLYFVFILHFYPNNIYFYKITLLLQIIYSHYYLYLYHSCIRILHIPKFLYLNL